MKSSLFFLITLFFVTKATKIRVQQQAITCDSNTISWADKTMITGSIRPFHTSLGVAADLNSCKDLCVKNSVCMTAIFTGSRKCYGILTNNKDTCAVLKNGSFGSIIESCSPSRPCQTSNKICSTPSCSLYSMTSFFCNTGDMTRAKTECTK